MVQDGTNTQGIDPSREISSSKVIIPQTTINIRSCMSNIFDVLEVKLHPPLRHLQFPPQYFSFCMAQELGKVVLHHENQDWELNAPGARQDKHGPGAYGKGRRKAGFSGG